MARTTTIPSTAAANAETIAAIKDAWRGKLVKAGKPKLLLHSLNAED